MYSFKKFSKLEYHKQLNPKIWNNDRLLSDVRQHLLLIAYKWIEFAKIPTDAIVDYTLTGGNCNFNYTTESDLDVHILVDPDKLPIKDRELMHDFIMTKKNLWAAKHSIFVAGYPVELYAQMTTETLPKNQGIYSLGKNEWIVHPTYLGINYRDKALQDRVEDMKRSIESVLASKNIDAARNLKDQITSSRSEGLSKSGEFDEINTAFKAIRNSGYLQKLSEFISQYEDRELSLN